MIDPVLLCVVAKGRECARIQAALAAAGIEHRVTPGDTLVVLEFGRFLKGFLEVRVERADLEPARALLAEGLPCFGAELVRELEAQGGKEILTAHFRYEGIQRLKVATREQVVELFRGSEYALLQRIQKDSPADLARFLVRRLDRQQQGASMALVFLGAAMLLSR